VLNTVIANTVFEQRVQHSKRYRTGHGIKEVDVHSNCCLWLLCGTRTKPLARQRRLLQSFYLLI
jgi:hypothetical protein